MTDLPALNWRKSSYSNNNGGACVEVATTPDGGRYVRDTKDRSLPPHYFTAPAWRTFIVDIKISSFD
ncbi:DUF397 domain-containing protein [Amycolatopsis sp. CA-230715]|uniref:DUF397 domain-containing protein n=1 Tax=Amycolatopsis sp. CA-230715 TaxID=2745196 RepID=UPI001C0105DA|nr:DUF397 domain-containing protein [Amycolatopsis sp. CA-230715]QWF81868.1 hypothetical protein HUW46_05301 [Amycolatopsis sp. CA-230715]